MESISLLESIKHKMIMSSNNSGPFPKQSVATSEKVETSEEVEKGSGFLDDIEDPKITEELEI